ncbi:MAG: P-type conjugative transfer protein TrbJ [Sedimenticola sp.]|nr:MAG: P-type conjugative transfer protein TrbJ [Sedimenticola sp.]
MAIGMDERERGTNMKSHQLASVLLIGALIQPAAYAGGGGLSGGALEITQIANNAELVGIYGEEVTQVAKMVDQINNQISMIANQLSMYQNMLDNTGTLTNQVWGNVFPELQQLAAVVQQGQAIAYSMSNLDAQFSSRFQGYNNYVASSYGPSSYRADYKVWYTTQRDGIHGALKSANLQASKFSSEEATLNQLENMSQTATGRMRALQVGNQISMQQVRQNQKLRELVMSQIQLQGNYLAGEASKDAARQARTEKFYGGPTGTIVGDGAQFGPSSF